MKKYWSKRNHLFSSEKYGDLLFAGNTGSFYKLAPELTTSVRRFIEGDEEALDDGVVGRFLKSGVILTESDEDFHSRVLQQNLKRTAENEHLGLTIAPTQDCNFRCHYCYEKDSIKEKNMSAEVKDALLEYIKEQKKKHLHITWYGGEPLLQAPFIENFTQEIKALEVEFTSDIVTNGYLLNAQNIEMLDRIGIGSIQITLDGSESIHNQRRPHVDREDSYQVIMKNIDELYRFFLEKGKRPQVSVRVNIDKENQDDFSGLYTWFKAKYGDFFHVYSAFVEDPNSCVSNTGCLMGGKDQKNFLVKQYKELGYVPREFKIRSVGFQFCQAQSQDSYVVDPEGNLYKCWDDIGQEEYVVGNLLDPKRGTKQVETDYIVKTRPDHFEKCRECVLIYSCQGDCPRKRLNAIQSGNATACPLFKQNLNEFLEYYYESKMAVKSP